MLSGDLVVLLLLRTDDGEQLGGHTPLLVFSHLNAPRLQLAHRVLCDIHGALHNDLPRLDQLLRLLLHCKWGSNQPTRKEDRTRNAVERKSVTE